MNGKKRGFYFGLLLKYCTYVAHFNHQKTRLGVSQAVWGARLMFVGKNKLTLPAVATFPFREGRILLT